MSEERNHIKIFVSSTVYDFETDLRRIFLTLDGFGYDVYMSKEGTIPLDSRLSNLVNCVNGVEECDIFLGIVRPLIGSGVLEKNGRSITAQEFDKAIELGKPRFVLADYRVEFAHKFLSLMKQNISSIPLNREKTVKDEEGNNKTILLPNNVVHGECVEIYRLAIQNTIKPANRIGNWAQPYKDSEDIQRFIESQFKDVERIKSIIDGK
ncbi:MAG: DUF4062 domain-containing protein [Bacteroidaceae bacterium]|nr:DUF4062 domain-containing protein [Bacteroidaceae bacterium]